MLIDNCVIENQSSSIEIEFDNNKSISINISEYDQIADHWENNEIVFDRKNVNDVKSIINTLQYWVNLQDDE